MSMSFERERPLMVNTIAGEANPLEQVAADRPALL
jgi:hypothetical protein